MNNTRSNKQFDVVIVEPATTKIRVAEIDVKESAEDIIRKTVTVSKSGEGKGRFKAQKKTAAQSRASREILDALLTVPAHDPSAAAFASYAGETNASLVSVDPSQHNSPARIDAASI